MEDGRANEILQFWFGPKDEPVAHKMSRWFKGGEVLDAEIRKRFSREIAAAEHPTLLQSWRKAPRPGLAVILLLDQFPRHVYRGTARAFAQDAVAREVCEEIQASGHHQKLTPLERAFAYLPFHHAEDLELQERSVELFAELQRGVAGSEGAALGEFARYTRRHRRTIARFGQFPHRNAILCRPSTPEEILYLERRGTNQP
jgi:uncharacterized protein (DUF924 family)